MDKIINKVSEHKHFRQENPVLDWVSLCLNNSAYVQDEMTKRAPNKELPSIVELRRLFDYDPDSGVLTHKLSGSGKIKGSEVGGRYKGYKRTTIHNTEYQLHRIIWMWMIGLDPGEDVIDHRNGKGTDNRWINLRLADDSKNMGNRKPQKSQSGIRGVRWRRDKNKWYAFFYPLSKTKACNSKREAAIQWNEWAVEYWGEFAYLNVVDNDK